MTATATGRERFWVPGDWNAFFGFGTNILVNLLVLTGLLRFVLKMPDALVFGRILPAIGLMLCLSTVYYAWLAYRLAKKTGRTDVCALPSGISVPHMFVVTFVVMLPILLTTKDPVQAWEAGLTWVFVQSFVLMAGGFIAPVIRKITPRAALLGSLAGISITFISMRPGLLDVRDAGHRHGLLRHHPGQLVRRRALLPGRAGRPGGDRRRHDHRLGLEHFRPRLRRPQHRAASATPSRISASPFPFRRSATSSRGFKFIGIILVTAIPFGIYDLVEAMDNVESAAAAGDSFPTTRVLTADGVVSLIGCLMGNPFINAVYIGHPGWKAMGGRIGYSAATGVMVIVLAWFGIIALISSLIPVVAILPILLYIGMLIGSQAFQETPRAMRPAIILAMMPQIAAWGKTMIDGALGAAGTNAAAVGFDKLGATGVLYKGLEMLGGGATLAGIILGAVTVFIIERQLEKAAAFARGRRGPDLLRPDPRRGARHRPVAGGGDQLSRHRRHALRLRQIRPCGAGRGERHRPAQPQRPGRGIRRAPAGAPQADRTRPRPAGSSAQITPSKTKQNQAKPNKSKQKSLDLLGFIRPNSGLFNGLRPKKIKKSFPVSGPARNVSIRFHALLMRRRTRGRRPPRRSAIGKHIVLGSGFYNRRPRIFFAWGCRPRRAASAGRTAAVSRRSSSAQVLGARLGA